MTERSYPRALTPVEGPIPRDYVELVLAGMGKEGRASRALVERGLAPPELATGLTLALLRGQSHEAGDRRPSTVGRGDSRPSAVAGGVWVREQLTLHAPLPLDESLTMSGASLRRFVRKGRLYGVTRSETRGADGRLIASNLTTGLEHYRADAGEDHQEGVPADALPQIGPDAAGAMANPALEVLRARHPGERIEGEPVEISIERLRDRDGPDPANPIHSDPEAARRAGLDVPIAGGAHVLAFAQELVLQTWGLDALSHGALVDARWIAPVRAGTRIVPSVEVRDVSGDLLELGVEVRCDGAPACVGSVRIPL
jgi:hypothetical protein